MCSSLWITAASSECFVVNELEERCRGDGFEVFVEMRMVGLGARRRVLPCFHIQSTWDFLSLISQFTFRTCPSLSSLCLTCRPASVLVLLSPAGCLCVSLSFFFFFLKFDFYFELSPLSLRAGLSLFLCVFPPS